MLNYKPAGAGTHGHLSGGAAPQNIIYSTNSYVAIVMKINVVILRQMRNPQVLASAAKSFNTTL